MLRTLIIDDEPPVRETLLGLLDKTCPQVKVVGEAESVASGIRPSGKNLLTLFCSI